MIIEWFEKSVRDILIDFIVIFTVLACIIGTWSWFVYVLTRDTCI